MTAYAPIPEEVEIVVRQIVDAGLKVHQAMGPGLLESVYETCLAWELTRRSVPVQKQVVLPVEYDGQMIEAGFRLDLLVDNKVIVEIKAAEKFLPIHEAQLLTYLRLSGCRLGLLMNFNTKLLRDGLRRIVL